MKTFFPKIAPAVLLLGGLAFSQKAFSENITSVSAGNWNVATNWLPQQVPGSGDNVTINTAIDLDAARAVSSLTIGTGGSLTGAFDLTISGLLTIGGGTLNNASTTAGSLSMDNVDAAIGPSAGTVTITGTATFGQGALTGKTLVLQGASTKNAGSFFIHTGATLRVASGATLALANTMDSSTDFAGLAASLGNIDNLGTITKSTGETIYFFYINLTSSGALNLNGGTLHLFERTATFSTGSTTQIAAGAVLKLTGFTSASTYSFTGGGVSGSGTLTVGNLATVNFSGSATCTANVDFNYASGGGTLNDNTTAGINPASVTLNNINPGGTWQGTGGPDISGALTMGYGTFNPGGAATAASLDWAGGDIGTAAGTSSTLTISGAVDMSGSDTKGLYKKHLVCNSGATSTAVSVDFYNNCQLTIPSGTTLLCDASANTVKFGSLMPLGGGTSGTLHLNGSLVKVGGEILRLKNIQINNNGSMSFSEGETQFTGENDINYDGTGSIDIAAGALLHRTQGPNDFIAYKHPVFTNNGTITSIKVKFAGTAQQTLAGNGVLAGIIVDNASNVVVSGTHNVAGDVAFTNGQILLQGGDLTFTSSANNITGYSSARYFVTSGMARVVKPLSFSTVIPVGHSTSSYNPVTIAPSGTATFAVRVQSGFDGDKPMPYADYVNREWEIERLTGSAAAALTFQWNTPGHTTASFTPTPCHFLHWDGSQWANLGDGNGSCASGTCTRTQAGVSDFSPFAISSGTALPVELVSFRGEAVGPANHFEWETASESNTKRDILQRSADGLTGWAPVAEVAAAGQSASLKHYEADDAAPLADGYYRLLFEDLDGRAEASPIVHIKRAGAAGGTSFSVFPNPVGEGSGLWLDVPATAIGLPLTVSAFDATGRLVHSERFEAATARLFVFGEKGLAAGAYFLRMGSEAAAQALPLLVR